MILENISLGKDVNIHPTTSFNNVSIGNNVKISKECSINGSQSHVVRIGEGTILGMYVLVDGPMADIVIGENVSIAQHNVIVSHHCLAPGSRLRKLFPVEAAPISIGDNTWIGSSCVISPGVKIGRCCIIASNSHVDKDVPDYTIAGGSPARIIRAINPDELM